MDITDIRKETRLSCNESFLTLLSGLMKIGALTDEEKTYNKAYNNALADAFDYIIETNKTCLFPHTVRCGKWVRDNYIDSKYVIKAEKPKCAGRDILDKLNDRR